MVLAPRFVPFLASSLTASSSSIKSKPLWDRKRWSSPANTAFLRYGEISFSEHQYRSVRGFVDGPPLRTLSSNRKEVEGGFRKRRRSTWQLVTAKITKSGTPIHLKKVFVFNKLLCFCLRFKAATNSGDLACFFPGLSQLVLSSMFQVRALLFQGLFHLLETLHKSRIGLSE